MYLLHRLLFKHKQELYAQKSDIDNNLSDPTVIAKYRLAADIAQGELSASISAIKRVILDLLKHEDMNNSLIAIFNWLHNRCFDQGCCSCC